MWRKVVTGVGRCGPADMGTEVEVDAEARMLRDFHSGRDLIPVKCACCTKCWLYRDGPRKGTCFYGGPYKGFVDA